MGDGTKWKNNDRTWDVALAFNSGIDKIKESTGEKAKLQSMPASQSLLLDNLGNAYDSSDERGKRGHQVPLVRHVPSRESGNYIRQGELSAQFEFLQSFDSLTGFLNDRGVRDELLQRVARANRQGKGGFGIVVMDIKNFKYLNDALGQNGGDEVLREITQTFKDNSRGEDSFWRIAGDEFGVLMDAKSREQLEELIFNSRHNKDSNKPNSGWLDSVNEAIKSKLKNLVSGTRLENLDLGDAGEIRAGIFYVNKNTTNDPEGKDVIGEIMKSSKAQLEIVKEAQKSKLMTWKKTD